MLQVQNICKSYSGKKVLDNVSFQVRPGEKCALIGVNGSGKTTLLKIILEWEYPDSGVVTFPPHQKIAYLAQEVNFLESSTLYEEMRNAVPHIGRMERKLRFLEEEMSLNANNSPLLEQVLQEYTLLQDKFHQQDGHNISWKIDTILQGLGFSLEDKNRGVSQFSGGWQMRIQLAKLLLQEVDLLLLDEPTNHLDINAVEWLEDYLKAYAGAVIIVSHDRYFLNRISDTTLFLNKGRLRSFPGNYDAFMDHMAKERELQEQAYKTQQKKIEKDLFFINRFRSKNTLRTRVQSRIKMLDKMDKIDAPEKAQKSIALNFNSDEKHLSVVFKTKDLLKEYSDKTVPLLGEMEISGGERTALVGENGSGKTTLLRILAGIDKKYEGRLSLHFNARIKYYSQNQAELLNEEKTVLESLEEAAPLGTPTVHLRTLLGSFLFRGDDVFKKVEVLSGGEKSRLALARMVCSKANVLLLDEPTNHLDIESREVLAEALDRFFGTAVIVSHDRYFIDQVCDKVVEINEGRLVSYPGNYTYYREKKKQQEKRNNLEKTQKKNIPIRKISGSPKKSSSEKVKKDIKELEIIIEQLENSIIMMEENMEDPKFLQDNTAMQQLVEEYSHIQKELELKLRQWENLNEQLSEKTA